MPKLSFKDLMENAELRAHFIIDAETYGKIAAEVTAE